MPAPKPILRCARCNHDLADLIETPWIRTCPECGTRFDADFMYEGNPADQPQPNVLPAKPPKAPDSHEPDP